MPGVTALHPLQIIERGWPGHFILASRCVWRRNTLLVLGERRIVVSGVGRCLRRMTESHEQVEPIGTGNRMMESMAFVARWDPPYWEADIHRQLSGHGLPWAHYSAEREDTVVYERIHNNLVGHWGRQMASLSAGDWHTLTRQEEP